MQRIREILSQRPDSEHEQALIRLGLCGLVTAYVAVAMLRGQLGPAATPLFAVCGAFFLLPGVRDASDAASVARRLLELLARPFMPGAGEFYVGASIGISRYPSDGNDVKTLIGSADMAMYHAKENGRNNYQYFNASMNAAAAERLALETAGLNHLYCADGPGCRAYRAAATISRASPRQRISG